MALPPWRYARGSAMDVEATVHQTYGDAPEGWVPDIRIEKVANVAPRNGTRIGAHHDRLLI